MSESQALLSRISANPDIFGGKPILRGLRISVETVLSLLAQGVPQDEILDDYPDLEPDDIRACLVREEALLRD
ncbi:MAG: DUF433 domain-containing protein [Acidobacteria bacterium]|nr:DUF433 domain-containing protein [Acidobacteriota bacterium]